MKPRLLDLFCGAGGAAKGYADAGFDVVGVDKEPQPNYPFEFHQCDALAMETDVSRGCWHESSRRSSLWGMHPFCLGHFDAIHASPPCQAYSDLRHRSDREHPDLVAPTRELLEASGLPWVMENVEGAPMRPAIVLCGSMFGLGANGRQLRRHRLFELSFPIITDLRCRHRGQALGVYGTGGGGQMTRGYKGTPDEYRDAMGIDWATRAEIAQAVPPAFTEHIGGYLLKAIADRQAA